MELRTSELVRPGGTVHYGQWGHGPRSVVAVHGLTANHVTFEALARRLDPDAFTIVAPDLRGRGRSARAAGPYGMAAHADDLVALLDANRMETATLVGHSMGGFVSVVAADRHPERIEHLVLVDGGLPLDIEGLRDRPIEEVVRAVVGPALDRLAMTFASPGEHLAYWRAHPALADSWNDCIERTYTYDLVGAAPSLRSSVDAAAVLEDSASELTSGDVERALSRLTHPATLVRAERGIFNQLPPLYPEAAVEHACQRLPQLRVVTVADSNHYTVLLGEAGADALGAVVRAASGDRAAPAARSRIGTPAATGQGS